MAVDGKYIDDGTLDSLATSNTSVPNISTTNPTSFVSATIDTKTSWREKRERVTVKEILVSIFESGERSLKSTGGRKTGSMNVERESRVDFRTLEGEPSVG